MVSINELVKRRRKGSGNYSKSSNTSFGGGGIVWTPITPLTVKGGVVRVIDSATGDIAITTSTWIEDEKYAIYLIRPATAMSAEFDSAVTRTGRLTVKVSTTDITGRGRLVYKIDPGSSTDFTVSDTTKYGIPVKPSTAYKLVCYAKTENVATNSVYLLAKQITSAGVRLGTDKTSNKISGTNDWTKLEVTFTTDSTAAYLALGLMINVAGNISDAWFDVNSMTLEEVTSITNSSSSPALFYPTLTAVTSTDNIDQSQVNDDNTQRVGEVATKYQAQQFTPTKKNFVGVIIRKRLSQGTYTGDVTISLRADNSSTPALTDLISVTIPNAIWEALTVSTDYTVLLPQTLTIGNTYWITWVSSTSDNSNYTRIASGLGNSYSGGVMRRSSNGSSWSSALTDDAYFKTLYSKNTTNLTVSTDTQTVSVTAPTPDGWENGITIDSMSPPTNQAPLTLAPGANNIYVSSNGPATADGEVDPSLQVIIGGYIAN